MVTNEDRIEARLSALEAKLSASTEPPVGPSALEVENMRLKAEVRELESRWLEAMYAAKKGLVWNHEKREWVESRRAKPSATNAAPNSSSANYLVL